MNRQDLEQLARILKTDERVISDIMSICLTDQWDENCKKVWCAHKKA